MKGFRFLPHAVVAIVLAVVATTLGCNTSQPMSPSQPTAAVQSGQSRSVSDESLSAATPAVPASAAGHESLSAATLAELAQARAATAKYHDVAVALADGYVQRGYGPGEGYHFVKASLRDCTFDLEHPEILLYVPTEAGFKLVAVEYIVPNTCPVPEGFTGDADEWELEVGPQVFHLNAWVWLANPNGIFAETNPLVPLVP